MSQSSVPSLSFLSELGCLSRWGVVAFAIRCAHRSFPLTLGCGRRYRRFQPQFKVLIETLEQVAATAGHDLDYTGRAAMIRHSSIATELNMECLRLLRYGKGLTPKAVEAAIGSPLPPDPGPDNTRFVRGELALKAVAYALGAAECTVTPSSSFLLNGGQVPSIGLTSVEAAVDAARFASAAAGSSLADLAMQWDFELLRANTSRKPAETPVDPKLCGPLWPFGKPDDWPGPRRRKQSRDLAMRLEFTIPQGVDRKKADKAIVDILAAASQLHRGFGGSGLRILDSGVYEARPAMVPVGGGR